MDIIVAMLGLRLRLGIGLRYRLRIGLEIWLGDG